MLWLSFIKLISLLYYNPKVCFSDLAPNIIYSQTDECCPITYFSTWIVIEFCLSTLRNCLNKPGGALQHSSRTETKFCACEAARHAQQELETRLPGCRQTMGGLGSVSSYTLQLTLLFYNSVMPVELLVVQLIVHRNTIRTLVLERGSSSEYLQVKSNPFTQSHKKVRAQCSFLDAVCYSQLLLSLLALLCKWL